MNYLSCCWHRCWCHSWIVFLARGLICLTHMCTYAPCRSIWNIKSIWCIFLNGIHLSIFLQFSLLPRWLIIKHSYITQICIDTRAKHTEITTGFPQHLQNRENLENYRQLFQSWKCHRIWKNLKYHGKIWRKLEKCLWGDLILLEVWGDFSYQSCRSIENQIHTPGDQAIRRWGVEMYVETTLK